MSSKEIKELLKREDIYMWMIAKTIGIHESTLIKWLRTGLSMEQEQKVLLAIEEVKLNKLKK